MTLSRLSETVLTWLGRYRPSAQTTHGPVRGARDHVILLDGTDSSLEPGTETNVGLIYKTLCAAPNPPSIYYEPGVQWANWNATVDVMLGRGINRQICRAYGFLASRYRPGDRIFLIGYSRGAFAVRSLAGVIDMVGLLRAEKATERNVRQVYRLYRTNPRGRTARLFAETRCHSATPIEMIGVFDTVKALGLRLPLLWRLTERNHAFHNHHLGPTIRHGFQALARDETRDVFTPVLWTCPEDWPGNRAEQVWFRGTHGDIGGHIGYRPDVRPLSNIPLVWMLRKCEALGLSLPTDWPDAFPCDPTAPSVGTWQGFGKLFLLRGRRTIGLDPSESLHETAVLRSDAPPSVKPHDHTAVRGV